VKHFLSVVSLVAFSACAASAADTSEPAVKTTAAKTTAAKPVIPHVVFLKYKVAPADEYFGKFKMSILGIRNTIKDMGLKVDADQTHAVAIVMGSVALTEDAMRDWETKYPRDTWLPPAILSLERLYAKVDSDDARAHAKKVMAWLVHDYPSSAPGKIGQKELAENRVGVKPAPQPTSSSASVAGDDLTVPAK
jgi:hypothetical protein